MSQPRFIVVYAANAQQLQESLNGYDDYDVVQMTSGPWFDKSGPDNSLEQVGDSIYVLLELKTPDVVVDFRAEPRDLPGRCGRRHKH